MKTVINKLGTWGTTENMTKNKTSSNIDEKEQEEMLSEGLPTRDQLEP